MSLFLNQKESNKQTKNQTVTFNYRILIIGEKIEIWV